MNHTNSFLSGVAMALIFQISKDVHTDSDCQKFRNVAIEDYQGIEAQAWEYICNNPDVFMPVITSLGMKLEENCLSVEETVFYID